LSVPIRLPTLYFVNRRLHSNFAVAFRWICLLFSLSLFPLGNHRTNKRLEMLLNPAFSA
jgi:hypothetical protein